MNGDQLAARFIADTTWEALPPAVQAKARMCLMDNLGACISGAQTEVSRVAAQFAAACLPGNEAAILGHGCRASAAGAAFANGCAANGLDTDDSARYAYGHAGAQLFPTSLALAQTQGLGGAELLTGMVAGYEIAHRMGRCWHDHHEVYQACGAWGSVACAATAANLLRLPAVQVQHAMGIAEYHAPNLPMMRDIAHPAMVKHGIGWGALTGIHAAQLAACGFTGIPTLFSFSQYREWIADIGQTYLMLEGVSWKAQGYACCGWVHAAAQGAKTLLERHKFNLQEIETIEIETFREAAALGTRLPETTEEAQFNLAWPVAAMLVDGEIGPAQTLETRLRDPQIRKLAAKVRVCESAQFNELRRLFQMGDPRGRFASAVRLTLSDGRRLESGQVGGGLAFPQPGWDESQMEAKFRWLAAPLLPQDNVDELVAMIRRFHEVENLNPLIALIES
jgi:2-methylcitrate dehydratase PrpD